MARHLIRQTDVPLLEEGKRAGRRQGDRRAERDGEGTVVSLQGIKAGYIRVSSDRIKDGMPDPFSACPHPPMDAHAQCAAAGVDSSE